MIRIPSDEGGYKAMVASFPWSEKIGLILDDYAYTTELNLVQARLLVGALQEHIRVLNVLGSDTYGPTEFVD